MKGHERRHAGTVGLSKDKRLHELLGRLGNAQIRLETFWKLMKEAGLSDADVEDYCDQHARWIPDPEVR
jgi:hypothetical protein